MIKQLRSGRLVAPLLVLVFGVAASCQTSDAHREAVMDSIAAEEDRAFERERDDPGLRDELGLDPLPQGPERDEAASVSDLSAGSDGHTETEFPDPVGDLAAVSGFPPDPAPPPDTDVTGAVVSTNQAASQTVIVICFAGPAQNLVGDTPNQFGMDILIDLLNIIYKNDDTSKISDPPPGVSVSHEWASPDKLRFTLDGWDLEKGTTLKIFTLAGIGSLSVFSGDTMEFTWEG